VLPGVANSQIFRGGQWYETWTAGQITDTGKGQGQ
jgi:hypothetical protein